MASTSTHFTYNRELQSHLRPLLKRKEARNGYIYIYIYIYISPAYPALTTIKTYTKNFTTGSSNFPSLLYFSKVREVFIFDQVETPPIKTGFILRIGRLLILFSAERLTQTIFFLHYFSENTAWNLLLFLAKPLHILWQHLQSTTEEERIEMQGKIGACKEHWMVLRSLMQMFFSRAEVCFHEKRNRRGMGK